MYSSALIQTMATRNLHESYKIRSTRVGPASTAATEHRETIYTAETVVALFLRGARKMASSSSSSAPNISILLLANDGASCETERIEPSRGEVAVGEISPPGIDEGEGMLIFMLVRVGD